MKEETHNVDMIVTQEIRQQIQAKQIVQHLASGKTYKEIAEMMEVHRDTLYALVNNSDMKPLIIAEITGMETEAQRMIRELDDSQNSANKRHALTELGKMIRHSKDKIYPTIFRSENINVNVTLEHEKLQRLHQVWLRALSEISPDCKDKFWERYNATKREWG